MLETEATNTATDCANHIRKNFFRSLGHNIRTELQAECLLFQGLGYVEEQLPRPKEFNGMCWAVKTSLTCGQDVRSTLLEASKHDLRPLVVPLACNDLRASAMLDQMSASGFHAGEQAG